MSTSSSKILAISQESLALPFTTIPMQHAYLRGTAQQTVRYHVNEKHEAQLTTSWKGETSFIPVAVVAHSLTQRNLRLMLFWLLCLMNNG